MNTKHTPGPWQAKHRSGSDGMYRTEIFSDQHGGIANCDWTPKHCGNGVTKTYREANARLIAAAPDLLEALQAATDALSSGLWDYGPGQDEHERCDQVIDECRAAIAKATGDAQ